MKKNYLFLVIILSGCCSDIEIYSKLIPPIYVAAIDTSDERTRHCSRIVLQDATGETKNFSTCDELGSKGSLAKSLIKQYKVGEFIFFNNPLRKDTIK
jgi:hypothetical protein